MALRQTESSHEASPDRVFLSMVLPCYNEAEVLNQTHTRLQALFAGLAADWQQLQLESPPNLEVIYVNDGSKDGTLDILQSFANQPPISDKSDSAGSTQTIRVVSFSRNFGHQAAIAAGLLHAKGDWVATIDADLQDPPEIVVAMLKLALAERLDVVHGKRKSREGETLFKRFTAYCFYRLLNWLSGGKALNDVGDFRIMSRRVVQAINRLPERSLYLRGLLPELGYPQKSLEYDRPARAAGITKYTLPKMIALAFEGITAVSVSPLKIGLAFGAFTAAACICYVVAIIFIKIFDPSFAVRGWPSLMVAVLFLGAVQLLSIGILGEYIGQIHREVKHRPRFFVDEKQSRL
jgi:glycosyltransferase involved in cell wall biosynthesis